MSIHDVPHRVPHRVQGCAGGRPSRTSSHRMMPKDQTSAFRVARSWRNTSGAAHRGVHAPWAVLLLATCTQLAVAARRDAAWGRTHKAERPARRFPAKAFPMHCLVQGAPSGPGRVWRAVQAHAPAAASLQVLVALLLCCGRAAAMLPGRAEMPICVSASGEHEHRRMGHRRCQGQ